LYKRISAIERGTKTGGVAHVEMVTPIALLYKVRLGHITVDTCGNLQFHIFLLT